MLEGRYRGMMIFCDVGMTILRNWNQCIVRCELLKIVDISFVRQVVILVSFDDFSKLLRALFMISTNKFLMK